MNPELTSIKIGNKMFIVGIDPGLRGGIASITSDNTLDVAVMPLVAGEMHPGVVADYLTALNQKIDHVFIEHCQAMPKQGVSSMFKYGVGFGMLQGVVAALHIPYTLVKPREWQRSMHKGSTADADPKDRSAQIAYSLFPGQSWKASERCKKDHDGMIDAALIATYGLRVLSQPNYDKAPAPSLRILG